MDPVDTPQRKYSPGGFWALIATQFQGAFNDNLFKWVIVLFLLGRFRDPATGAPDEVMADKVIYWATVLFSVPFILSAGYAGALADRFSKQRVMIGTKYWELGVMTLGLVAFLTGSTTLLWLMLFLMAMQSAFFSPAKYGILPEILPEPRLSWGNGVLQMGTFVAIILGTAAAGPLRELLDTRIYLAAVVLMAFSVVGIVTSHGIARPPAANPRQRIHWNPWAGLGGSFRVFLTDRWLFLTMLGIAYFWFAGTLAQQNIVKFGSVTMGWSDTQISLLQATLALGIGVGSFAAGILSRGKIEVGLIPLGALAMALTSALLGVPWFGYGGCLALLAALGFGAGFYNVPLAATLQQRSPDHRKGAMIAAVNLVTFAGMLLAGVLFRLLGMARLTPYHVFLVIAATTLAVGIYICAVLPIFLLRFGLWVLANTIYRLRVLGRDNVPVKGGALLVANHTSFLDAMAITASTDRLVRFVMYQGIFDNRWVRPIAKVSGAIPISATGGARELVASLRAATEAVKQGEVVCIFAEGQISRTGQMLSFRKGYERIMRNVDAPIIPVHLDRLWGSVFSFSGGRFFWKFPRRIPYPVTVSYGAPMSPATAAFALRSAIQELGTEAYTQRKLDEPLLHRSFVKAARRHPLQMAIANCRAERISFIKTLAASIAVARKLKPLLGDPPMTGLLLPPSVGGVLVNVAMQLMGKIPVNLNYTASAESLASSGRQCHLTHVVTSREFLEKVPLDVPGEPIISRTSWHPLRSGTV